MDETTADNLDHLKVAMKAVGWASHSEAYWVAKKADKRDVY